MGQIVRRIRYSNPQRVTPFRRSYRLVSGRSLFEDSITSGDATGARAAIVREAIFYEVIPTAKPSHRRRGETANSRLFYPTIRKRSIARAVSDKKKKIFDGGRFIGLRSI